MKGNLYAYTIETQLTPREKEILTLLADGYNNEEVAEIVKLSRRTVEAHRARIMLKLEINTLAGLVKYALQVGLTSLDSHRSYGEKLEQAVKLYNSGHSGGSEARQAAL